MQALHHLMKENEDLGMLQLLANCLLQIPGITCYEFTNYCRLCDNSQSSSQLTPSQITSPILVEVLKENPNDVESRWKI